MSKVVTPASPARRAARAVFIDAARLVARPAVAGPAAITAGARPRFGASQTMMCCAPAACSASTIEPTLAANDVAVARIVPGMLGAAADRGERRTRVVAAAGDDVEAVRRSMVAGGREVLGRLDEEAERKAARPGAGRSRRGATEREVGAAGERRRERQADHRREVARPHRPVAVRAGEVGVRGDVGVAGDDLGRVVEAGSGVVAAIGEAVAEHDEAVVRAGAGGRARECGDDEG